jgi:hypothetical protein
MARTAARTDRYVSYVSRGRANSARLAVMDACPVLLELHQTGIHERLAARYAPFHLPVPAVLDGYRRSGVRYDVNNDI